VHAKRIQSWTSRVKRSAHYNDRKKKKDKDENRKVQGYQREGPLRTLKKEKKIKRLNFVTIGKKGEKIRHKSDHPI